MGKGKGRKIKVMRTKKYYVKKYKEEAGTLIYKLLQKEAAHARWKDHYLKKLKECREQVKRQKAKAER